MDNFRSLLLSLNDEIEEREFESMKFACKLHIGAGILERFNVPVHLFAELENRNLLGPENKDFLVDLLVKIGRQDLKNKLLGIQGTWNKDLLTLFCWYEQAINPRTNIKSWRLALFTSTYCRRCQFLLFHMHLVLTWLHVFVQTHIENHVWWSGLRVKRT